VAFSPDGKTFLTAGEDKNAWLRETRTGKLLQGPLRHQSWVRAVAFSPDGRTLLTGSADKTARLWEAATGQPRGAAFPHDDWVASVAFSPDGRRILTGSKDKTARLWELAPAPVEGPAERIVVWTEVLTGMEADLSGGLQVLDGPTWQQRRRRLQEQGGPPVVAGAPGEPAQVSRELIARHQQEADRCFSTGQWVGAVFHLEHLIKFQPDHSHHYTVRGRAHAQLGQWQKARADYARVAGVEQEYAGQEYAGILLLCDATREHRQYCEELFQRFGQTTDAAAAHAVARTLVMVPHPVCPPHRAVELADMDKPGQPKKKNPYQLHTLGLAHYRAGQYEQAIRRLNECLNGHPRWCAGLNWLVLAMAYQRLGKTGEARQALDKALRWGDQLAQNQPPGAPNAIRVEVHNWLAYNILRREAEAQLERRSQCDTTLERDQPALPPG
jgi:Flp pilus assembly protein TadD